MAEERVQRRLAAILAADVVGYSRLVELDEAGTVARLRNLQDELIRPMIARDGGRIVKVMGDGVLAEFGSAVDAVSNALSIQSAMAQRNIDLPEESQIKFRVGINVGDVIIDGDDIHGDGVNIAARLESVAEPGTVYISGSAYDQVAGKLEAEFENLGEQSVKNISRPVQVYCARGRSESDNGFATANEALRITEKPSIAVLPFSNMSGDPEQEYFSDGITEDLITALSCVRWLLVIARNTTFLFKGRAIDVKQIAKQLGVRFVLEGSVRKVSNRVRVTAQLIDGVTANHVWAHRYDRDIEDIFDLQDELTETIVAAVQPAMQQAEQDRVKRKPPESLDAWESYQRGMWHMNLKQESEVDKARVSFEHAIKLDPNFAPAYAGLSFSYSWGSYLALTESLSDDAFAAARKAVELDQYDPDAHAALGYAYYVTRDHARAVEELRMAIELNPSSAYGHYQLAGAFVMSGNAEAAIPHARTALRLSPSDSNIGPFTARLAHAYMFLGQYEVAVEWARKALRYPNISWPVHIFLVASLAHLGRIEETQEALNNLLRFRPGFNIAVVRQRLPITDGSYLDHLINGLRKAGLPEN